MKRTIIVLAVVALAALSITAFAQRSKEAETLFHRGVHFEEVRGELKEAVTIYEKLIKEFADVRPVVAKAILHMGICQEKMGQKEARKSYQRIIDEFSDQSETAAEATVRLNRLGAISTGVIKPSAPAIRRVWEGVGYGIVGVPSPDGQLVCTQELKTGNLLLRDLVTGEERVLTSNSGDWSEYALYPHFSADGKQLAYAWYKEDGKIEIRTIRFDGSGQRTVFAEPDAEVLAPIGWFPDGQSVLLGIHKADGSFEIVRAPVKAGPFKVIKRQVGAPLRAVRLSPEGLFIAYSRLASDDSQNFDIFSFPVAGGEDIPIIEHAANDNAIGWTPDGQNILFISDRTGSRDLWIIRVADGRPQGVPELLRKGLGEVTPLGLTAKGAFFYGVQSQISDVFEATLDVEAGRVLSSPKTISKRLVGSNDSPAWSPDGKFLAYILREASANKSLLCLRSTETGEERDLAPEMYLRWPLWSPDGKRILVWGRKYPSDYGFYFVDPQTGAVAPFVLNEGGKSVQQAVWSPDGKDVFFRRFGGDEGWFIKRNVETGQETELFHNYPIHEAAISPDGQTIIFRSYGQPDITLKTMPASGGDIREIVRVKSPEYIPGYSGLAWTPDGRFVLYFTAHVNPQNVERTQLWRVDVSTGERKSFGVTMDRMRNIALHPDGKRVAFDSGMPKVEIWVMENFLK